MFPDLIPTCMKRHTVYIGFLLRVSTLMHGCFASRRDGKVGRRLEVRFGNGINFPEQPRAEIVFAPIMPFPANTVLRSPIPKLFILQREK